MKRPAYLLIAGALLVLMSTAGAQGEDADAQPTWQQIIAEGLVPYRQLTVNDFPVKDNGHPQHGFYVKAGLEPRYHFTLKSHKNGFVYAYVDQWLIFSGLKTGETWRKSTFKTMKEELPFAQAILDLNEITARQIAALKLGELPQGRGSSFDSAHADLEAKMKKFLEARYRMAQAEIEAFVKATENGADKKKVRQLAAEIRKRLDATPATTVQFAEVNASPEVSATPSAAAVPSAAHTASPR